MPFGNFGGLGLQPLIDRFMALQKPAHRSDPDHLRRGQKTHHHRAEQQPVAPWVKALRKQTKAWYTKASMDSPRATGLFRHGSLGEFMLLSSRILKKLRGKNLRLTRRLIMARVLIIGASKGIGLETVRSALEAGHQVRALARSATSISLTHPQLEKVRGNALVREDVEAALQGVDVVIQTLGVSFAELFWPVHLFSDATRVLVAAMAARGVKRLICVTGFGACDSRDSISVLQRLPFHAVFGRAYADKSIQEQLIKETTLDWTIVRPGVLTGGVRTGLYQALDQPSQWRNGIIARADVADFCVKQIGNPASVRKAYVLVN